MHKSFFLTLFAILCIESLGFTAAQAVNGVGIYEVKPNLVIGSLSYTSGSSPTPLVTIPNSYYAPSSSQLSTYNYNTKILTMMVMKANVGGTFMAINCTGDKWTTHVGNTYTFEASFTGLASDQGPGNGVFATYSRPQSAEKNLLYVGYLLNLQMAISEDFVVRLGFANNKYPIIDTPLNFVWDPSTNTIIATVEMRDTDNQPQFALAFYDPVTYLFVISNMYGNSGDTFYSTTYLGAQNAYTFASSSSGNSLYTWDFSDGAFVSTRSYETQILAAF
ncbi:hypothetical protein CYY_000719 [Polysphondylium violaceum]|uniref:PKD domain-containing protein n=1 Tax=Polysphondylium violaceum TaxID=133409 RepID=A0A8J4Q3E2_9MYCE|nr:hypothetical protein CYY_000719 [Polysphondylium violaceum]